MFTVIQMLKMKCYYGIIFSFILVSYIWKWNIDIIVLNLFQVISSHVEIRTFIII